MHGAISPCGLDVTWRWLDLSPRAQACKEQTEVAFFARYVCTTTGQLRRDPCHVWFDKHTANTRTEFSCLSLNIFLSPAHMEKSPRSGRTQELPGTALWQLSLSLWHLEILSTYLPVPNVILLFFRRGTFAFFPLSETVTRFFLSFFLSLPYSLTEWWNTISALDAFCVCDSSGRTPQCKLNACSRWARFWLKFAARPMTQIIFQIHFHTSISFSQEDRYRKWLLHPQIPQVQ